MAAVRILGGGNQYGVAAGRRRSLRASVKRARAVIGYSGLAADAIVPESDLGNPGLWLGAGILELARAGGVVMPLPRGHLGDVARIIVVSLDLLKNRVAGHIVDFVEPGTGARS